MSLPSKRGKHCNAIVDESFTELINDKFKGGRATCKYCQKELDRNTSCLQDHLNVCKNYQEAMRAGTTPGTSCQSIRWLQQQITTVVRSSPQKRPGIGQEQPMQHI